MVLCNSLTLRPIQPVVVLVTRVGRLPNVHRLEVRPLRVGIADALNDGQFTALEQPVEAAHARN